MGRDATHPRGPRVLLQVFGSLARTTLTHSCITTRRRHAGEPQTQHASTRSTRNGRKTDIGQLQLGNSLLVEKTTKALHNAPRVCGDITHQNLALCHVHHQSGFRHKVQERRNIQENSPCGYTRRTRRCTEQQSPPRRSGQPTRHGDTSWRSCSTPEETDADNISHPTSAKGTRRQWHLQ